MARTAWVLRRTSLCLGLFGAAVLLLFSGQVSTITFGTAERWPAIALVGAAVLFRIVSAGQAALIQGMRRVSDLAMINVAGAGIGTTATILLVFFFRADGVAPSLIAVAAASLAASWWYSRRIEMPTFAVSASQLQSEVGALLKLGFAFMASGVLTMGSAYVVRTAVLRHIGFQATGLYQAAWTLGGLYVGFILQAMAADFYPRLTASATDNVRCNGLVNEQATIGMLLAGPGIMATLTFAPVVLTLFYSSTFTAAVDLLRWICLGVALRVVSWPLGYIIVAKGEQVLFLWTELAWATVHTSLALLAIRLFGLQGAGMAFFVSYVFHCFFVYLLSSRLTGFRCSPESRKTAYMYSVSIALTALGVRLLPPLWASVAGLLAFLLYTHYSVTKVLILVPSIRVPSLLIRLFAGERTGNSAVGATLR